MGLYQAPVHSPSSTSKEEELSNPASQETEASYCQMHLGFYPPLLRSSTVKKYLVGLVFPLSFSLSLCLYYFPFSHPPLSTIVPPYGTIAVPRMRLDRLEKTDLRTIVLYTRFELFAETQRDITPEQAAQRLRDQSPDRHYKGC